MKKLQLMTREIGTVSIFDISGAPTNETLDDLVRRIQKRIRRHRLQRVILNLQDMDHIDAIGMRKLMAACLRPQRSLIYGASEEARQTLSDSYLPQSVKICNDEEAVAEDFGPFLFEKGDDKQVASDFAEIRDSIGYQVERRRSKRMHVAIPVELIVRPENSGEECRTKALITNISEGGLFAEYLDMHQASKVESLGAVDGFHCDIRIPKCSNFPEDYELKGIVLRKEMRKKQLGLALKFVAPAK